jgi:hypothetical protein
MHKRWKPLGLIATTVALFMPISAMAQSFNLDGRWWTPLGVMRVSQVGAKVKGIVSWKCETCSFKRGDEIFKGVLVEDSISGQFRFCYKGKGCPGDGWAPLVMLVAREGKLLSGAAHFNAKESCKIGGKGDGDGVVMRKLRPVTPKPKEPLQQKEQPVDGGIPVVSDPSIQKQPVVSTVDESGQSMEAEVRPADARNYEKNQGDWRGRMEEAKSHMENGFFERARKKFIEASDLDPTRPEAFNGVGVTYYARGDYDEALNWYKKSLEVNPNFGDAYYNMACIYSLMKKKPLAFQYLHIAALNGFIEHQAMEQDPDLNNLRSDQEYQEIFKEMTSMRPNPEKKE